MLTAKKRKRVEQMLLGGVRKGGRYPTQIAGLAGRWEAARSAVTVARDGTGALSADGDLVGRVTDLSGNNRHLEASADGTRPTFESDWLDSGLKCIRFTTSKNLFNEAAGAALAGVDQPWTVFFVGVKDRELAERYFGALTSSSQANCDVNFRNVSSLTTADLPVVRMFHRSNAGGGTNTFNSPAGYGGIMLGVFTFQYTGTRLKAWQNGFELFDEAATTGTFTFTHFSLGCSWDGTTQTGQGDLVAAASLYSGALSDAERQKVERYYANVARIPYVAGAALSRRFFSMGDSRYEREELATGQDGEVVTRRLARMVLATETVHVCRAVQASTISGADTSDLTEQWADVDGMVTAGDVVLINVGVNDIRTNATITADTDPFAATDTQIDTVHWPAWVAIGDAVLAAGCDLICDPVIPARSGTWSGGEHHGVDRFNATMAAWAGRYDRACYNDAVLDAVTTGGFLNVADSSDSLHLNSSGHPKHAASLLPHIAHFRVDPRDNANLVRWYSARMGLLFDDTDPIGDTGLELQDRGTIEDHAAQASAGARPTWQLGEAASNYQATVLFDGTDDALTFTETSLADDWTIIIACDYDDSGNGHILGKSGALNYVRYLSDGTFAIRNAAGDTVTFTPATPLAAFDVITLRSDGRCWINGVEAESDAELTGNLSLDTIGNLASGFFKGQLADVLLYDAALNAEQINEQAGYIAHKLGKTWTNI
jgi:lysophospholipase L1-like esterase